ncbi:MAG: hypothetical protein HC800_00930 [Phormidesmis sp. RL_2_1]|nr:hypothetical protein [Phormidesmis sp. RL_2_1]
MQAIAPLQSTDSLKNPDNADDGYLYIDGSAIAAIAGQTVPAFNKIQTTARPLLSRVDTLAVTRHGANDGANDGVNVSFFIRLKSAAARVNRP